MLHQNWTSCPVLVLPSLDWLSKLSTACTYCTTLLQLKPNRICILQEWKDKRDCFQSVSGDGKNKEEISVSVPCFDSCCNIVELNDFDKWSSYLFATCCSWKHTHTEITNLQLFHLTNAQHRQKNVLRCVHEKSNIFQFCFRDKTNPGTF